MLVSVADTVIDSFLKVISFFIFTVKNGLEASASDVAFVVIWKKPYKESGVIMIAAFV